MPIDAEDQVKKLQAELAVMKAEYQDFVYTITHDLTGPFRQIEGFSSIILESHGDQFNDKTRRHFDLIIGGSQKGKNILEALQYYSQLITTDYRNVPVDCNNVVAENETELASLTEQTGAHISYEDLPIITGDYAQLYLLFYQLIHNALHYQSPDSTPMVSIAAVEADRHWQFTVQDNGIGFREKLADRIFTH